MPGITRSLIVRNRPRWVETGKPKPFKGAPQWYKKIAHEWRCVKGSYLFICWTYKLISTSLGEMTHIIVRKVNHTDYLMNGSSSFANAEEPSYTEKCWIQACLGMSAKVSLEVYPEVSDLCDGAMLYHFWSINTESQLPFDVSPITKPTKAIDGELNGENYSVEYALVPKKTKHGTIAYLFIKPKDPIELGWKQKYDIKNQVIGDDFTAVEVLSQKYKTQNYSCLICLPHDFKLDFGLHHSYQHN